MKLEDARVGFALCGSYCTYSQVFAALEDLVPQAGTVIPILSEQSGCRDTRFGTAAGFRARLETLCGNPVLDSIVQVEPIGPKKLLDLLIIAPCTGNTLAKLSHSIADTPVTMAVKSHLRNARPVVIAVSTNDGLAGAAENIGRLMARKNCYFVPYGQDDPEKKPTSLVAHFELIPAAVEAAMEGRQLQPVLL